MIHILMNISENKYMNGLVMCSMNGGVNEGVVGDRTVIEGMKKTT